MDEAAISFISELDWDTRATRLTYALVTFSMAPAMIRTGSSHTAVGRANHSATDSCYVSDERNERGREFQVVGRAQSSHNI